MQLVNSAGYGIKIPENDVTFPTEEMQLFFITSAQNTLDYFGPQFVDLALVDSVLRINYGEERATRMRNTIRKALDNLLEDLQKLIMKHDDENT